LVLLISCIVCIKNDTCNRIVEFNIGEFKWGDEDDSDNDYYVTPWTESFLRS